MATALCGKPSGPVPQDALPRLALTGSIVDALRKTETLGEPKSLMESVTNEMGFRYYVVIHHDDLGATRPDRVDLKDYPAAITERLFIQNRYRRDPTANRNGQPVGT